MRNERINSDVVAAVYLRITVDGERAPLSTKTFIDPQKWHPAKGRFKDNTEAIRLLNGTIENFEHRAREVYNRFLAGFDYYVDLHIQVLPFLNGKACCSYLYLTVCPSEQFFFSKDKNMQRKSNTGAFYGRS